MHETQYANYGEYQDFVGERYVICEDVTRCQPPASVTINGELLEDQIVPSSKAFLTLHDAYEGENNPIRGYEITYHSLGSMLGGWSSEQEYKTILTDKRSLDIEVDVSSYKRKYVVRTLGTRTEDTYNSYKTSSPAIQMTQFTAGSGVTELFLEKALSTSDVKLIWRGAGFDENAEAAQLPIQHYTIQRSESPDGRTWSEWEDLQNDCGYPPLPSFEYTGEYTAEPHEAYGWLITLKTSGELTFHEDVDVDVFAVGGGGSGAGVPYTSEHRF